MAVEKNTWVKGQVFTNGPPKAGNHLLVKAVQLLGVPCEVNHTPYEKKPQAKRFLFIKRDPRDMILSAMRFRKQPITQGMYVTTMKTYMGQGSIVEELATFEGWLSDPDTMVVRFEDMLVDDTALRAIAEHLGTPLLDDAFDAIPGGTFSWSGGPHSDFRSLWSPAVDEEWSLLGGRELLERWGY